VLPRSGAAVSVLSQQDSATATPRLQRRQLLAGSAQAQTPAGGCDAEQTTVVENDLYPHRLITNRAARSS